MNQKNPNQPTKPNDRTHNVTDCPRCGGEHPRHAFRRLSRPSRAGAGAFSWWSTCPRTREPIMADLPEVTTA